VAVLASTTIQAVGLGSASASAESSYFDDLLTCFSFLRTNKDPTHQQQPRRCRKLTAIHHSLLLHLPYAVNSYLRIGSATRADAMAAPPPDLNAILAALGECPCLLSPYRQF
jgi:hypothetical protein